MHIKAMGKNGKVVPYSPTESLDRALLIAIRWKNTPERIYCIEPGSVKGPVAISSQDPASGTWTAKASGEVRLGYTVAKTDEFHVARGYYFEVEYASTRDELNLPDVRVLHASFTIKETNPARTMGFPDKLEVTPAPPTPAPTPVLARRKPPATSPATPPQVA